MNWRDVYEDKDTEGCDVIDVMLLDGVGVAYVYQGAVKKYVHHGGAGLIKKPKPKTYRPFKFGEVKCGDVFKKKDTGILWMITGVSEMHGLIIGGYVNDFSWKSLGYLYDLYTKLDGTPAGMEE